jgi:hypothetical protein
MHQTARDLCECPVFRAVRSPQGKSDGASRAFVGLLVHSAADGFAVGAACVGGSSALSGAIALAMVLHKARPPWAPGSSGLSLAPPSAAKQARGRDGAHVRRPACAGPGAARPCC